jgi:hypothetical protein
MSKPVSQCNYLETLEVANENQQKPTGKGDKSTAMKTIKGTGRHDVLCSMKSDSYDNDSPIAKERKRDPDDAHVPKANRNKRAGYQKSAKQVKKQTTVRSWTADEKAAVWRHLGHFVQLRKVPNMVDCLNCKNAEKDVLKDREWRAVKYHIASKVHQACVSDRNV